MPGAESAAGTGVFRTFTCPVLVTRARTDSSRAKAADDNDNKNITGQNSLMMSKRCSDVVEPRVEHAILDAESRRNAVLNFGFGTAPAR